MRESEFSLDTEAFITLRRSLAHSQNKRRKAERKPRERSVQQRSAPKRRQEEVNSKHRPRARAATCTSSTAPQMPQTHTSLSGKQRAPAEGGPDRCGGPCAGPSGVWGWRCAGRALCWSSFCGWAPGSSSTAWCLCTGTCSLTSALTTRAKRSCRGW